jgi:mycoredoxin
MPELQPMSGGRDFFNFAGPVYSWKETGGSKGHMQLLVYSSRWCPDCREAKRFLQKHNIAYQDVDIESTPGAAEQVFEQTGKRSIPQFVIDGEWVQPYRPGEGFLYAEMARRLGVEDP